MSITPNMNLLLPTVTVTPGPTWAAEINAAFGSIDSHNHTSGQGSPVPALGLNIDNDLTFNSKNAYALRSTRFAIQGGTLSLPADLACLYSVNGDLYYNSGAGIPIQITIGAGLNASSIGGIGGDYVTSGASVFYTSANQTFTFWQASNTSAYLDVGPLKIHSVGNSNYVTLSPNASMVANYNLTLPISLPASGSSFLMVDSTGAISDAVQIDNQSIKIIANQLVSAGSGFEHGWELNGSYGILAYPQTNIDSVFFAQYGITITSVVIYSGVCGSSGITEYDLKYKTTPSGSWVSVLGTTGKIAATSAITLAGAAGVATATLTNHGFVVGESVTISGVTPTTVVTSLSASAGVATVTLASHGYVAGNYVTVSGATPAAFNGTYLVTSATSTTFTYAVSTALSGSASGTIVITGYNGIFTVVNSTTNNFTYAIPSTLPGSPTGSPVVATRSMAYTDSGSVIGPQAGIVKPVLSTTSIPAGSLIRWDLLQSMSASSQDARIRMYYRAT